MYKKKKKKKIGNETQAPNPKSKMPRKLIEELRHSSAKGFHHLKASFGVQRC